MAIKKEAVRKWTASFGGFYKGNYLLTENLRVTVLLPALISTK